MDNTYYPGSDTKITAPFYLFRCQNGHQEWCVTPVTTVPLPQKRQEAMPGNFWERQDAFTERQVSR